MVIQNPILTGSFTVNNIDVSSITSSAANITALNAATASLNAFSASVLTFTSSAATRLGALEAATASLYTATSSFSGRVGALESYTSSLNLKTASFATTGSNNFTAVQHIADTTNPTGFDTTASLYTEGGFGIKKDTYISSSLYIKGNLTVYGTQSVSYITSSQLNISTNLITVNTATPSIRFGGLAVIDSGSASGLTGSLLWDSQNNNWLYSNPSGSGNYDSSMVIMGPRNSSTLGNEQGLNCNYLVLGHGSHHTTSSAIFHDGTNTCIPNTLIGSTICTTMANASCIGIGTYTPSDILDVQKNQNATTNIYFRNTDNTNAASRLYLNLIAGNASAGIAVLAGGVSCGALYIGGVAGGYTYFQPSLGGTVSATITAAGCFGIGTTSPESTLHICGGSSGGYAGSLTLVNNINATGTSTGIDFGVDASTAAAGNGNAQIKVCNIGSGLGGNAANMIFSTWNGAAFGERFVITCNGNVQVPNGKFSVNTASISNALTVYGSATFGTSDIQTYAGPSQYGSLSFPKAEILFSNTNPQAQLYFASNAYNNSSGVFAYRCGQKCPVAIGLDNGGFSVLTAGTGTVDTAISWSTPLAIMSAGRVCIGGGDIVNTSNNKAHTFCQLNSGNFSTKNFTFSGTSNGSFAVTDFSGIPSNAKAVQVAGWYHITGYSSGAGQGDHAMSWFGPATLNTTTQWGGPGAGWPNGDGTYVPRFHGTFVMEHDGDASGAGMTNYMNYYGSWHQGTINVHTDGYIYYSLGAGLSGGTHYNALIATGYWI